MNAAPRRRRRNATALRVWSILLHVAAIAAGVVLAIVIFNAARGCAALAPLGGLGSSRAAP